MATSFDIPPEWRYQGSIIPRPHQAFWRMTPAAKLSLAGVADMHRTLSEMSVKNVLAAQVIRAVDGLSKIKKVLAVRNEQGCFSRASVKQIEQWYMHAADFPLVWAASTMMDMSRGSQVRNIIEHATAGRLPVPVRPRTTPPQVEYMDVTLHAAQVQAGLELFVSNFWLVALLGTPVVTKADNDQSPAASNNMMTPTGAQLTPGSCSRTCVIWFKDKDSTPNIEVLREASRIAQSLSPNQTLEYTNTRLILISDNCPKRTNIATITRENPAMDICWWPVHLVATDWFHCNNISRMLPIKLQTSGCGHVGYHFGADDDVFDGQMNEHVSMCTGYTCDEMAMQHEQRMAFLFPKHAGAMPPVCKLCAYSAISSMSQLHQDKYDRRILPSQNTREGEVVSLLLGLDDGDLVVYDQPALKSCRRVKSHTMASSEDGPASGAGAQDNTG